MGNRQKKIGARVQGCKSDEDTFEINGLIHAKSLLPRARRDHLRRNLR